MKSMIFCTSLLCAALLAGCSSDDPDDGSGNTIVRGTAAGVAVDGYVAGALVYWDTNNNQLLDSWEPKAFTDNDGYYSRSKIQEDGTRIDYCAATATEIQAKFCLETLVSADNAILRLVGGYDIFSGEPFQGALTLRTSLPIPDGTVPIISPITTLIAQIDPVQPPADYEAQRTRLLALYGLGSDGDQVDFLADSEVTGGINSTAYEAALKLQKTVDVISGKLESHYESIIGEEFDVPVDLSSIVFKAYQEELATITDLSAADDSFFQRVLSAAETELRTLLALVNQFRANTDDDLLIIPEPFSANDESNRIGALAVQLSGLVDTLFDELIDTSSGTSEQNTNEARALQRAVEVVVEKIIDEDIEGDPDESIDAAINLATGENGVTQEQQDNYLAALESTDNDISVLYDNNFTDPDAIVDEVTVTDLDIFNLNNDSVLLEMAGSKIRLAGQETKEDNSKTSLVDVIFYFLGGSGDMDGSLVMCATYQENISRNDDDDIDRERFTGTWELLDSVNDSTVLIKVSLAGGDFSLVVKSIGLEEGGPKYRFNFQGDLRTFEAISTNTSIANTGRVSVNQNVVNALEDGGVVPSTSADCASAMRTDAFSN